LPVQARSARFDATYIKSHTGAVRLKVIKRGAVVDTLTPSGLTVNSDRTAAIRTTITADLVGAPASLIPDDQATSELSVLGTQIQAEGALRIVDIRDNSITYGGALGAAWGGQKVSVKTDADGALTLGP
jgi:hypothetical protein